MVELEKRMNDLQPKITNELWAGVGMQGPACVEWKGLSKRRWSLMDEAQEILQEQGIPLFQFLKWKDELSERQ